MGGLSVSYPMMQWTDHWWPGGQEREAHSALSQRCCVTSDNLLILSDTPYLHVHNGDISIKLQEEGIDED